MKRNKGKKNPVVECVSRKYKEGDKVIGHRSPNLVAGTFVRCYATLNNGWRNMAYVIKCNHDGKERSFQFLSFDQ